MIILAIFLKIPIRYKITWLPAFAWLVVMLACKEMCARMSVIFGYYYVVMLRIKIDCCTENYFDRFIDVDGWLKGKKIKSKVDAMQEWMSWHGRPLKRHMELVGGGGGW